MTIFNWLNETILPLSSGGEISAIYMGAIMSEVPTPKPPIILAITRKINDGARADAIAETAYKIAAKESNRFLPYLSLKGPVIIIAKVAVSVRELTAHPNSNLLKLKAGVFVTITINEKLISS